jgi:hypothetical protein
MDDVWPEKEAHMFERSEFMRFPAGHRPCREPEGQRLWCGQSPGTPVPRTKRLHVYR